MKDKKPSFQLSPKSLHHHLESELGLKASLNEEEGQVEVMSQIAGAAVPLYLDAKAEGELLQIIGYLPYEADPDHFSEIARLLHRFNLDLDLPGFCLDEEGRYMFYRLMLPCLNQTVEIRLLNLYIEAVKGACELGIKTIEAINDSNT